MNERPAVTVENLWKRYGFRKALAGVDLEIRAGTSVAIFGPNGAGKSTLLKILATRARPTSGRVTIFDNELGGSRDVRRDIGVVFHEHCLRNDLTLDENLRFHAGLHGANSSGERVDRLVALMGLSGRRRDPVRTFSQGMLRRATLIRSLLHDPKLWLLDEPFAGLDPGGRRLLADLMRDERDGGRTVVFVSHDVEQGLALADDAVVLRDAEVAARGIEESRRELER